MKYFLSMLVLGVGAGTAAAGLTFFYFSQTLPEIISLDDYKALGVTEVIAKNSSEEEVIIGEFFKERRYLVPFERIPKLVINAFISAEDDGFFDHQGISPVAILRAAIANIQAGTVVQGGSTITQQVAKSLFLSPERSIIRKIKEAILAGRIERNLTKEQILYLYLNQIYLGNGAYGVQAAAKNYFRKDVSEINLEEAALLAGLPRAPSKYSPFSNPIRAKQRQRYVLRRMTENGYISEQERYTAAENELKLFRALSLNQKFAPYIVEHVRRHLVERYGEDRVYQDGLKVYVPSTVEYFKASRRAIEKGVREVDQRMGFRGPIQHIEGEVERHEFIEAQKRVALNDARNFETLLPEGALREIESPEDLGEESYEAFLKKDRVYEAIVSDLKERAKYALVWVRGTELRLPLDRMEWAYPYEVPNPKSFRVKKAPEKLSQVLKKGDVVNVTIENFQMDPKVRAKLKPEEKEALPKLQAALAQNPRVQAALFSVEAKSGRVLAMEGGYDFVQSQFNRVIQSQRQPGSSFKPIIYSNALEFGYTPATQILDAPIVFRDEDFGKWKPTNFAKKFYGDTTLRFALINSRNIPTIKIVQDLGVEEIIGYSRRLGMQGEFNKDLSISLGSATSNLFELTQVFSLFPRQGFAVSPIFISKVADRDGQVLEEYPAQMVPDQIRMNYDGLPMIAKIEEDSEAMSESSNAAISPEVESSEPSANLDSEGVAPEEGEVSQVVAANRSIDEVRKRIIPVFPNERYPDQRMDPRIASIMSNLLSHVVQHGTGRRAKILDRAVAGKTGTTNDYKDAWFMGFSPEVVTGVWVGFDDSSSLGVGETGSKAALPIWISFMGDVLKDYPLDEFAMPNGVEAAWIDETSGGLIDPEAETARETRFLAGSAPTRKAQKQGAPKVVDDQSEFWKQDM